MTEFEENAYQEIKKELVQSVIDGGWRLALLTKTN